MKLAGYFSINKDSIKLSALYQIWAIFIWWKRWRHSFKKFRLISNISLKIKSQCVPLAVATFTTLSQGSIMTKDCQLHDPLLLRKWWLNFLLSVTEKNFFCLLTFVSILHIAEYTLFFSFFPLSSPCVLSQWSEGTQISYSIVFGKWIQTI